jgi:hypothetical protein
LRFSRRGSFPALATASIQIKPKVDLQMLADRNLPRVGARLQLPGKQFFIDGRPLADGRANGGFGRGLAGSNQYFNGRYLSVADVRMST